MGFDALLDHTCNIYHIKKTDQSPGYNLPASPSFSYPAEPDESGIPCHFGLKSRSERIVQNAPHASLETRMKLSLPVGTDIRINDKVVDCGSGYEYTAEVPHDVRGHHLVVWLRRTDAQGPL